MPLWYRVRARVGGVAMPVGFVLLVVGLVGRLTLPESLLPGGIASAFELAGFLLLLLAVVLAFLPVRPRLRARPVGPPVAGRWTALNSPASKVPSHGVQSHGQTFAIDLVFEPEPGARPAFGEGPAFRPPEDFPAFGREVFSPADGRVVAVWNSARDHRSRSTWAAYAYMFLEGFVRELAGARHILGNHVVLDLGGGAYATLAHLQRGSAMVRIGQAVRRGEPIGRCGNSGNSSEPHVHFQLMDRARPLVAAGLPFVFDRVRIEGQKSAGGRARQRGGHGGRAFAAACRVVGRETCGF